MVKTFFGLTILAGLAWGQTLVNGGRTLLGPLDASGAAQTAPNRVGTSDPATCTASKRETFFNSTTNTLKVCTATNVWTAVTGGGGLADPGANGLVKRTGAGTTAAATGGVDYVRPSDNITGTAAGIAGKTTPAGALAGDSDSQSLTNKTMGAGTAFSGLSDWTEIAKPANPSAGSERIYAKAAAGLCALDSTGTERCTGSGGGGSPGGTADGQLQYKSGSAFGADAGLSWNTTNKTLALTATAGVWAPMTIANTGGNLGYSEVRWTDALATPISLRYGYFNAGTGAHTNWQIYSPGTYSIFNIDGQSMAISLGAGNSNTQTGTLHVMNNWPSTGVTLVTLRGGPGQAANDILEVQSNAGALLGKITGDGQAAFQSLTLATGAPPACDSTQRGKFWYTAGGTGVKDAVQVCAKDTGDAYAWRSLY